MKTTLKHIAFGTIVFLLFTQMSFINKDFLGKYKYFISYEYMQPFMKLFELKPFKHKFNIETAVGVYSKTYYKGTWKVEDENVILIYRKRYDKEPDTLKIKRLATKIDSLGIYNKLNTDD